MSGRLFTIKCRNPELAKNPEVLAWIESIEKPLNDAVEQAAADFAVYGSAPINLFKRRVDES